MKKRYISTLFASMMMVSLALSACSGNTNNSPDNTGAAQGNNPDETAGGLKPYHLVMAFPGSTPKDLDAVNEAMSKYLQEKINATIELRPIDWGAWNDKTNLMFASQEPFDVIWTSSWQGLGQQVAKGQIIPVDDLINSYGKDIKQIIDPEVVEGGKINGKIYGVVTNKEFASTRGIVMRKDLVEKYGIDTSTLKELKDFTPVFEKIKAGEAGMTPIEAEANNSPLTQMLQYDGLGDGPGGVVRGTTDLKVVNMVATPEYMDLAKLMNEWYKAGFINKDAPTRNDGVANAVKAGKAFSYAVSMKPGIELQESRNTGMPMVAVELTQPFMTTGDTTSSMLAIPTTSSDPERAMMFINLLYTDKYLINLLNWGIEGTHYTKVSDNIIDYPQGVTSANSGYNLNQSWMFGNQMNTYLWKQEDPDLWSKYKTFNESAEKSPALGFVFAPDSVKNEITAVNNVSQQFSPVIVTGAVDPAVTIPDYLKKLEAAGVDKIIAEKQRQLDEWAKTNK
ncbi:ABC transporter substrate-binding protein [Paenibacillus sabinae]|uniref:Extracellular solute-binding protein n=1 Tax=Paenibacillus sabinae T27 TaxID=1268072 RepID=X4ZP76_9BACL|nr:ABC transporter substrate-binding protein [Paenibacillus sabinae]AHV98330.1 extracellular solute-binding protein [Paenibacillus sabinae T27]